MDPSSSAIVEAKMGDEKVKDRTLVGGEKRPTKSTTKTQMKLSSTAFKSSRPQTVVQKPSGDRSGLSSAVKLTKTNTTTTSKLSVPINRRNAPNDDPMRTSRSSITSPSPKIPVDRKRSKSQLTLITPIKPTKVAQFNNHTSSVSLARQKLTSGSSVTNCHRPGTRPHYLNKPNQMSLESQLTEKQRKFALVKKQLIDNQENCKQHFNEMIELNGKLSKMGGKQAKLEKLQLMYLVPIGDGVEEQAADKVGDVEKKSSTCDQSSGTDVEKSVAGDPTLVNPPTVFQPNVNLDMDQSTFKLVEDQLRMAHTAPFKLCSESLVNCCNLSSLLSEVSTIDELPMIVSQLKNSCFNQEQQIAQTQTEQQSRIDVFLKQLKSNLNQCDSNQITMNIKPQESGIEMPSESSNDLDITLMASELDQLRDENQRLHKHYATLMKASNDEKNDLCRKYQTQLHQSNETYAQLKEDLSMQRIEADEQRIFLKNAMSEKEQFIENYHTVLQTCDQLRATIDEFKSEQTIMQSSYHQSMEQANEKYEFLSAELNSARHQLSEQRTEIVDQSELQRFEQQLLMVRLENDQLRSESDAELQAVQQQLHTETARADQMEQLVAKQLKQIRLKDSLLQKFELNVDMDEQRTQQLRRDHEELKELHDQQLAANALLQQKLVDSQTLCRNHDETIAMHQRILRIRSELIGVLRKKGDATRCRMVDLYAEVAGKKAKVDVNKVDFEICAREEEMHNLFSTLSTKQMEVSRQDQLIKMLEECNAHNLRIRSRQFDRITRLMKDNADLKKMLLLAGGGEMAVAASGSAEEAAPPMSAGSVDLAFNRDMYCEERRKKRREKSAIVKPKSSKVALKREHSESNYPAAAADGKIRMKRQERC